MTLHEWYKRNADATGHDPNCARREVDMSLHRALDPGCERCRFLIGKLRDAELRREVQG